MEGQCDAQSQRRHTRHGNRVVIIVVVVVGSGATTEETTDSMGLYKLRRSSRDGKSQMIFVVGRRSSRDNKSRAIFVVGLGLSLLTDPIGLDGAR